MIGIGNMGKPMAMNLLKAGYPLTVYVRNPLVKKRLPMPAGSPRKASPNSQPGRRF